MSDSNDYLIGEFEITKSKLYPDGGIVYMYLSSEWVPFICPEKGDDRLGSCKLEEFLIIKLIECVNSGVIKEHYCAHLHREAALVDLVNEVFKTDFIYWPTEMQEKIVVHPLFGEVRIKDYIYDDEEYPDDVIF